MARTRCDRTPAWAQLQAAYAATGQALDVRQAFEADAQRFAQQQRPKSGAIDEEIAFDGSILVRVRTVNGVSLDALRKQVTDSTSLSLGRVGSTDKFTEIFNRIVFLQDSSYDRARRHKVNQLAIKATLFVNFVKFTSRLSSQFGVLKGNDAETGFVDFSQDRADVVVGNSIRLDHGKGVFSSHNSMKVFIFSRKNSHSANISYNGSAKVLRGNENLAVSPHANNDPLRRIEGFVKPAAKDCHYLTYQPRWGCHGLYIRLVSFFTQSRAPGYSDITHQLGGLSRLDARL